MAIRGSTGFPRRGGVYVVAFDRRDTMIRVDRALAISVGLAG